MWFAGLIGVIFAVGMLTILLWKVFTTITDRREFAQFEQASNKNNYESNTINEISKHLCKRRESD
jgi:hypothetical protein